MKNHSEASAILFRKTVSLFVVLFLLIGCALITIMVLLHQSEISSSQLKRNGQITQAMAIQLHLISDAIDSIIADLVYLSQQNEHSAFLETGDEVWIPSIEREYIALLKTKTVYDQLRFLDLTGKERVRVNYNGGQASAVDITHLQNKAGRYYFKASIILNQGEIYVSPLDLNVENGAIEQPLKPMIRAATPVYGTNGEKRGIIVINYLAENLLTEIKDHGESGLSETMLINSDAFWLLSPQPDQEWGFMIDDRRDYRFSFQYPDAWKFISHHQTGLVDTKNGLFLFKRVYPRLATRIQPVGGAPPNAVSDQAPGQQPPEYWTLIHRISPHRLESSGNALVKKYLFFSLSLLVIIAPGSWVMALETTRRRAQDAQLASLALVDTLTGLSNRRAFMDRLEMGLEHAKRYKRKIGLLYIDLDEFKKINDTQGHEAGDALLMEIGERLRTHSRKTDMIARLGGDEFACILAEIDSIDGALQAGKHLLALLNRPVGLPSGDVKISASIGAAIFPDHAADVNTLVNVADQAMYQAKTNGKNKCLSAQRIRPDDKIVA